MKQTKEIRNGSLYFNSVLGRVERAIGKLNSARVWTNRHENEATAVREKNLRKATRNEVDEYINESELLKQVPARLTV